MLRVVRDFLSHPHIPCVTSHREALRTEAAYAPRQHFLVDAVAGEELSHHLLACEALKQVAQLLVTSARVGVARRRLLVPAPPDRNRAQLLARERDTSESRPTRLEEQPCLALAR